VLDHHPLAFITTRVRQRCLYHALAAWYRDRKDDSRAQQAKDEYTDLMLRLAGDMEVGAVRPQIRPQVSGYRRAAKRPWAGGFLRGYRE